MPKQVCKYQAMHKYLQHLCNTYTLLVGLVSKSASQFAAHLNTWYDVSHAYKFITTQLIIFPYTDQLSIKITSTLNPVVGEGGTVMFIAEAGGINKRNFKYQWKRRGQNNIPTKASGSKREVLEIPNLKEDDDGQYFCTVTNEWSNKEVSKDITLTVTGNKQKHSILLLWLYVAYACA